MKQEKTIKYCQMCGRYLSNTYESICSGCYYKSYRLMKVFLSVVEKKFYIQPEEYLNLDICRKIDIREIFSLQKYWTRKNFSGHCKFCQSPIDIKEGLLICDSCFYRLLKTKFITRRSENSIDQVNIDQLAVKKFKKNDAIQMMKGTNYKTFLLKRKSCDKQDEKS